MEVGLGCLPLMRPLQRDATVVEHDPVRPVLVWHQGHRAIIGRDRIGEPLLGAQQIAELDLRHRAFGEVAGEPGQLTDGRLGPPESLFQGRAPEADQGADRIAVGDAGQHAQRGLGLLLARLDIGGEQTRGGEVRAQLQRQPHDEHGELALFLRAQGGGEGNISLGQAVGGAGHRALAGGRFQRRQRDRGFRCVGGHVGQGLLRLGGLSVAGLPACQNRGEAEIEVGVFGAGDVVQPGGVVLPPAEVGDHGGVQGEQAAEARAVHIGLQGGERRRGVTRALLGPGDQQRLQKLAESLARQSAIALFRRCPVAGYGGLIAQQQLRHLVVRQFPRQARGLRPASVQAGQEGFLKQFGVIRTDGEGPEEIGRRRVGVVFRQGDMAGQVIAQHAGRFAGAATRPGVRGGAGGEERQGKQDGAADASGVLHAGSLAVMPQAVIGFGGALRGLSRGGLSRRVTAIPRTRRRIAARYAAFAIPRSTYCKIPPCW